MYEKEWVTGKQDYPSSRTGIYFLPTPPKGSAGESNSFCLCQSVCLSPLPPTSLSLSLALTLFLTHTHPKAKLVQVEIVSTLCHLHDTS